MSTTTTALEIDSLKTRLKETWMAGDYDRFSRYMEQGARIFYEQLDIPAGCQLLDVACGSGQVALWAARDGVKVTGVDIAPNLVQRAQARAKAEGLNARFMEGDAEALPFEDASFDVVTSLFGAMFAPRPELVARELLRVCCPGGTIAMGNWTREGFIGQMFKTFAKFIAPSGMPAPVLWGDETAVRERLGHGVSDLKMTRRHYNFTYPFPPAEVVEFFRQYYGPTHRAFESLDEAAARTLREELEALWSAHNRGGDELTVVHAEYLEVVATRNEHTVDAPHRPAIHTIGRSASHRAAALAGRIEEGAAGLETFARGLSDAEWRTRLSATDRRSVGVVVHHVASMYEVEIDVARAIASGRSVVDVTWEVVAQLNAKHAQDNAQVSKSAALELLRQNSREAAAAVRAFTDQELDNAAPFSLSSGAPVTAQFVIEDHAMRHSWHHLAAIRKALGR